MAVLKVNLGTHYFIGSVWELVMFFIAAPADYVAATVQLVFRPGQERQCVNISIEDDDILERPEDFNVTLSTTVDRVTLDPDMATVTITDVSGKLTSSVSEYEHSSRQAIYCQRDTLRT